MFAFSRDGGKVFLHQPDTGMTVPVVLDLENKKLAVRVPSVHELENDYAVYDEFSDVLRAVGRTHRDEVNFARRFSLECSRAMRDQLSVSKLTVSQMRKMVEGYLRPSVSATPEHAVSNAPFSALAEPEMPLPRMAEFAKAFSAG